MCALRAMTSSRQDASTLATTKEIEIESDFGEWLSISAIHDIRSPLAIIKGYWELGILDPHHRDIISRNLEEMTQIVDVMLALHTVRAYDRLDMGALVREVCEDYQESARRKGLVLLVAGDSFVANGDGLSLRQCLRILLDNALDATPAGGPVEVVLVYEAGFGGIAVRDTGVGIPERIRGKLFEPGVTTKINGHGLGLAMARRILRQHQGDLRWEENRAGGTIFTMWLPLLFPGF